MASWVSEIVSSAMNTLAILVIGIVTILSASTQGGKGKKRPLSAYLWCVLLVLFMGINLAFQIVTGFQRHAEEIQRHTYNTDLIKNYEVKFDNMTKKRMLAATALSEYLQKGKWNVVTNDTDALDDVLGFFEELGYDEQKGVISAEVIHEYFDADVRFYYQASAEYIADSRVQNPDSATTFEYIKPLFEDVSKIEAKKSNRTAETLRFSEAEMLDYFQSETNTVNLKDSK
jgi:hypothetical protein